MCTDFLLTDFLLFLLHVFSLSKYDNLVNTFFFEIKKQSTVVD